MVSQEADPIDGSNFRTARYIAKNSRIMVETGFGRKVDSSGRLVIPVKLREQLHIREGQVYQFFTHEEGGKVYLCVECPEVKDEITNALDVLRRNGFLIEENDE